MTAFRSLALAMARGFLRDRMAVFFSLVFPLMFLVLFGGLLGGDDAPRPEVVQVGAVPLLDDVPAEQRDVVESSLELRTAGDLDAALDDVRDGDAAAAVVQDGDRVVVYFSQADTIVAGTVQGLFQSIVQSANVDATGQPPAYELATERVEDESLETIQFVTPGLLGWAVAMSATFGAATNLVVWRHNGLLRRLRLAPVRTSSVVLARVVVSLLVAAVQATVFIGLGVAAFGLQLTDSWWLVVPLLLAGTLAFLSVGLLAGAVARTEEGAVGMANFVVLPMAFLSGSFFSLEAAPPWVRGLAEVLPLKWLNEGMLDVMVRGQGLGAVLLPVGMLLAFTAVLTVLASRLFRWDR